MPTLGDLASVIRSKNAGPFQVTIDIMFAAVEDYRRTVNSPGFTVAEIARRYKTEQDKVALIPFERVLAIKITIPRRWGSRGSGSAGDRDVYGAQQHGPLVDLMIE
jgi:hypothetical protein